MFTMLAASYDLTRLELSSVATEADMSPDHARVTRNPWDERGVAGDLARKWHHRGW